MAEPRELKMFPDAAAAPPAPAVPAHEHSLSWGTAVGVLLEHAWLIGLCVLAAVGIGMGWIRHTVPLYASYSSIFLEQPKNIVNITQVVSEDPRTTDSVNNMIQLVQSHQLLEKVAHDLNLGANADFLGKSYRPDNPLSDIAVSNILMGEVSASQRPRSNILDICVEHPDPHVAQLVCRDVAAQLIDINTDERNRDAELARQALFPESEKIKNDYEKAQLALQAYREQSHVVIADKTEISALNDKLNDKRELRVSLDSDLKELPSLGNDPVKLIGLQNIANDPNVARLQISLSQQEAEVANMAQHYTEDHPKMIAARGDLKALQDAVNAAVLDAAQRLQPNYDAALAQEKSLETMILDRSRESITYDSLQHDLDKSRDLYQKLEDRINETDITQKLNIPVIHLLDDASFIPSPVKPDKRKIMLACLAAGLLGGVSLGFLLDAIDATIKTPEQIEQTLRLPVLVTIPQFRTHKNKEGGLPIPEITNAVRESLRSMAVSIQLLGRKGGSHIILFTSAQPAEGKTFCSYHCAVQLATLGHRTLLIDADLRKPSQHQMLAGSALSPGLREYLSEQASSESIIMPTKMDNLFFIAAGKIAPNPLRLLTGPAMSQLLENIKDQFQFIILDSAPINPVADTLLLAPHVHQICLIARGGSTTTRSLRHTIAQLRSTGKHEPSNVILNRFQQRRGLYYYGYYSYHKSYGKHGSYGDENEASPKA